MEPSLSELMLPGLKLMVVGMGIVFLFLSLLVWIINVTSRLVKSAHPEPEPPRRAGLTVENDEAEQVAVIAAALRLRLGPPA
ncbi:MAG: OadG family protein [Methylococcus sp.]|jgi:oxaloacetate decarboxylase gamma subunit